MPILPYRKTAALLAAALLVLNLAGCGGEEQAAEEPVEGTTIGEEIQDIAAADSVFSLNSDQSDTMNPYSDTSTLNHIFLPLVYDTLFHVDGDFNVTTELVSSYNNVDGTTWTFYVDTSVRFHDGSTLTAHDAAYSLLRAARGSEYGARLSNVLGVSAMSDEMFMVSLYEPNLQFPALLNIPVIKDGAGGDTAPAGTGAYRFNDDHTALVLWQDHPLAADMPIDTIYLKECVGPEATISAFEDSLIDLVTNDPTGIGDLGYGSANEKRYVNTTNLHYIGFNQNSPFFCYPKFRMFLTYVIDREEIVDESMSNCAQETVLPISPLSALYNEEIARSYGFDMTKATAVLKNAGAEDLDADGLLEFMMGSAVVDISIDFLVCGDTAGKVSAARSIAENMRSMGLEVNLKELSWDAYLEALEEGEYDMYYAEVKLSADFNLQELLLEDGSLNFGGITDPGYETYLADYLAAGDADRQMYCDLMCKYILDTAPIVPICFEMSEVLTHRGVVSGADPTQYDIFDGFENWTIDLA